MNIAFLGLGAMGSRMATNLLKAGHDVTVWNRSTDRTEPLVKAGASVATNPADAVRNAAFVIAMVRDDEASQIIWFGKDGAAAAMQRGAIAIECSTLSVEWIRQWHDQLNQANIASLDAPVVGSRPQAEAAQLIFLSGGDAEVFECCKPILSSMGDTVEHTGSKGSGSTIKLAVNALFAIQVGAVAELIGLARSHGVSANRLMDILALTPTLSPAAKGASVSMLSSNFAPMFPVDLVDKDMGYVQEAARKGSPLVNSLRQVLQQAQTAGLGNNNLTVVAQLYA
jgi:3-hydroxyisobutyrate dehydrogenase